MAAESQQEEAIITKLPLLLKPHTRIDSPDRSGMRTPPPSHTAASIPFQWEDEPGKPKPCTALSCNFAPKSLDLPPRLILIRDSNSVFTKSPSPTTVLDGPYSMSGGGGDGGSKSRFQSSSFRVGRDCYGSFRVCSPDRDIDEQKELSGSMGSKGKGKGKGVFGSWRRTFKGNKDIGGGSYVFPSSVDRESDCSREEEDDDDINGRDRNNSEKIRRIRRFGSFSSTSSPPKSKFWTSMYQGLKQVVPWKTKKVKGDGLLFT